MTETGDAQTLPLNWRWIPVGDAGEVQLGRQRSPKHHTGEHMRPYLRVANVFEDRIDTSDVKEMNFTPAEFERYQLLPEDILLNEGQSPELLGRPAMYRGEIEGCCFQNTLVRFRAHSEIVEPRYALYYFIDCLHSGRFQAIGTQTTNIAHLGARRFSELGFPLPPLPEQRRIVDALEAAFADLDAGVAAIEAAQRDLDRYRRSVLKAAVEGALTADWRRRHPDAEPAAVLLARVADERHARWEADQRAKYAAKGKTPPKNWRQRYKPPAEADTDGLPDLPEGWGWACADQVFASFSNGTSAKPTEEAGTAVLRISAVRPLSVDDSDIRFLPADFDQSDKYALREGDLLFTRYNGSWDYVGVCGRVGKIDDRLLHPDKLMRGVPVLSSSSEFLEMAFNAGTTRQSIYKRIRTTAGQAGISQGDVLTAPVPVPPEVEQVAIVEAVEERLSVADAVAAALAQQRARADRLRKSVLQRAFAGALVTQDPAEAAPPRAPARQAVLDFGDADG